MRSQHNRRLPIGARLWDEVQASESLGEIEFTLGARVRRRARVVRQALRLKRVTMGHGAMGAIEMTCLVASEVGAPAGDKPVCWRLLTNRLALTLEQARELIEWYGARAGRSKCSSTCSKWVSLMFDPQEIRAAYVLTKKLLPSASPSLDEVVRRIAMLSGFLARKGDGEPGVKTLWIGLQRVMEFAAGVRFMRDSAESLSCV